MSILTDKEIRRYIEAKQLVPAGEVSKARGGAYEFAAGKVFVTGERVDENLAADWTRDPDPGDPRPRQYAVRPASLIWIRTREVIELPENICAFWWQTHTLSKQGLMLVNMSMVPAGYKGLLSCLFVNFGNRKVMLDPSLTIAKLVFMKFDQNVTETPPPYLDSLKYDRGVQSSAMASPEQFLHLGRFAQDLGKQRDEAVESINDAISKGKNKVLEDLNKVLVDKTSEIEGDLKGYVFKSLGFAALAVVILTLAMEWVPYLQTAITPNLDTKIASRVEQAVVGQIEKSLQPTLISQETLDDIRLQLMRQSERLQQLEARPDDVQD